MDSKNSHFLYYHQRLFILFLALAWLTMGCFIYYQYGREKLFKVELLNERLQLYNLQLLGNYAHGESPQHFLITHASQMKDVRMTLIRRDGTVIFDSEDPAIAHKVNHLSRPEVQGALNHGTDYAIRRSSSTNNEYFYSATCNDSLIARSAAIYNVSLINFLRPDNGFLWLMWGITILFSILGYIMTRHLGDNIRRLRKFALKVGAGERIDMEESFAHDELGEISNQIVRLYSRLLDTMDDRDREKQAAIYEAQEKIRIKRELTNNINHELKTPLASIRGYLETIISYPDMDPTQRQLFIKKSFEQTVRLTDLLSDVSMITRMEETDKSAKKELVDLRDIFESIMSDMQLRPENKRMTIHCDIRQSLVVNGDPNLLRSIFENLTDNAVDYSSGTSIFIDLKEETEDQFTFVFADDGVGVEERHLRYLFDRFYRVDKGRSRKLGGTGLGLSIVKNAVLYHGGTISVKNGARGGLEFTFSLKKK